MDLITNTRVAGLPCTGNYHTVTAGLVPPLVVLIHARGRQGWRVAVPGRGCCHLPCSASPPPTVKLCGNQLCKGRATCRVTARWDRVNKEWKSILLRHLYFTGTRGEVVGAAMTVAEWFPVQMGNYYTGAVTRPRRLRKMVSRACPNIFLNNSPY